MKAVIMAGGEGTRLRPLTANQPKPMLPLANRPIMEHIVHHVRRAGITEVVVTVQFLASQVRNYFGDGQDMGVDLRYATETTPLGTAGSVRNAAEQLRETFVVISGDALTDIDVNEIVDFHRSRGAMVTVGLKRMENPLEFGIVITGADGRIERFLEKPHWGQVFSDTINTGIYVMEPEVFDHIPPDRPADFSSDVFPALLQAGKPMFGFVAEGYWEDVGNLTAYRRAHEDILDGRVDLVVPGFEMKPGVWIGEGAEVDPEAKLEAPVLIGDFAKVEAGAHLREYTVIGNNVVVKSGASLHRAVVHDNAWIGSGASLRGCVVGRGSDVKAGGRVEDGAVIGVNADIGEGASIQPNVKVYPFKTVEAGAVVTKSIIWEGRGARSLFGEHGVTGIANVDVTPELALRLGLAVGTMLRRGSRVAIGRDAGRMSRVFMRALVAGLTSTGVTCEDLQVAPAPTVRFGARLGGSRAGLYVRSGRNDGQSIEIAVFRDDGGDIDEAARRRVERTYFREEFRRSFGLQMGLLTYPPRVTEQYMATLLASVDADTVRRRRFKLVIDAGAGTCALLLPQFLGELGLDAMVVNGALDEGRIAPSAEQRQADDERLAQVVRTSGAALGARLDSVGERLVLVGPDGQRVGPEQALLLFVDLLARSVSAGKAGAVEGDGAKLALPVSTTSRAAELAAAGGCAVVWTKLSASSLMAAAQQPGVLFAGSDGGEYVFPAMHPTYDGLLALGKLLELLAQQDVDLSEALRRLPQSHVSRRRVVTPWDSKGAAMRGVVDSAKGLPTDSTDGVKIFHDGGWALVVPDTVEPVTHIWAESGDRDGAERLADHYERLIRKVVED